MSRITLTINGTTMTTEVQPRTSLADFLREDCLLTGTHLGCEHGVCGACTLLIDGVPARSCIAFTVACDGANVRTIEGLENDAVTVRLRAAFTAEHALQCGYCTPGMLVTARDIVQRLPDADEARIRLELAGNLCRCTGYAGVVRAIRRVLADGVSTEVPVPASLPALVNVPTERPAVAAQAPAGPQLVHTLHLAAPIDVVWAAIQDPNVVIACVPGARLLAVEGDRLRGEVRASLGPMETLFTGEGQIAFDAATRRVELTGEGYDGSSRTRLSARSELLLRKVDEASTDAIVTTAYTLRGPLAQFARGAVVQELSRAIATAFANNLTAHLSGESVRQQHQMRAGWLLIRSLWQALRTMLGKR